MGQWVNYDQTLVMVQAKKRRAEFIVEKAKEDGVKMRFFYDTYYPEEFGWTAVAFYPMTKEQGEQYFKGFPLA